MWPSVDLDWLKARTEEDPETGCWIWQRSLRNGYGSFTQRANGQQRSRYAHRAAWEAVNGAIPDDLVVDHLCFRPSCLRPDHLQLLRQGDNARRRQIAVAGVWECGCARTPENTYTHAKTGVRSCLPHRRERSRSHYRKKKGIA